MHLDKLLGFSQRAEAAAEILQGLLVEIEICIVSEKRTINGAALQPVENLARLRHLIRSCWIIAVEQQGRNAPGYRSGGVGCVLIRQHHYCYALVRKYHILRRIT